MEILAQREENRYWQQIQGYKQNKIHYIRNFLDVLAANQTQIQNVFGFESPEATS